MRSRATAAASNAVFAGEVGGSRRQSALAGGSLPGRTGGLLIHHCPLLAALLLRRLKKDRKKKKGRVRQKIETRLSGDRSWKYFHENRIYMWKAKRTPAPLPSRYLAHCGEQGAGGSIRLIGPECDGATGTRLCVRWRSY